MLFPFSSLKHCPIADAKCHCCPSNDPLAPVAVDHCVSVCQSVMFLLTWERKQLVQQQEGEAATESEEEAASHFVGGFFCPNVVKV